MWEVCLVDWNNFVAVFFHHHHSCSFVRFLKVLIFATGYSFWQCIEAWLAQYWCHTVTSLNFVAEIIEYYAVYKSALILFEIALVQQKLPWITFSVLCCSSIIVWVFKQDSTSHVTKMYMLSVFVYHVCCCCAVVFHVYLYHALLCSQCKFLYHVLFGSKFYCSMCARRCFLWP